MIPLGDSGSNQPISTSVAESTWKRGKASPCGWASAVVPFTTGLVTHA